ncbi:MULTISPECIES: hypothetical protein [Candidatus Williamhamiltonella]
MSKANLDDLDLRTTVIHFAYFVEASLQKVDLSEKRA